MSNVKHGQTGTRLHRIWKSTKCRCYNHSHPTFAYYGARGIAICDEWRNSFINFAEWAYSHGYSDELEIDRIDVNQGYSPTNCRWITHYEQTINRRDTLYVVVDGVKTKLYDFCVERGISRNSINAWRYLGILEQKISEIIGQPVKVFGGKKKEVVRYEDNS